MPARIYFEKKRIAKCLMILAITALAMMATGGAGFAILIPFAFFSLIKNRPEDLFFYTFAIIAMIVCNAKVIPKDAIFFMEQRITMMIFGVIMALRVAGMRKSPLLAPFMMVMPYIVFMTVSSCFGFCPFISYLKLLLFVVVFLAYWGIANVVSMHPRDNLIAIRSVILSIAIFFLIGSIFLLPFPGLSQMSEEEYLKNPNLNSLFMGLANHSQCLGPMVSGLATILFADLLFGVRQPNKLYLVLLACCPVLIWKTSSRTAMGTFLSGLMFASYFFMRARWVGRRWKGKVMGFLWVGGIALFAAIACSSSARLRTVQFIMKRGEMSAQADMNVSTIYSTRQGLIDVSMANFKKKPLMGNGFQVREEMQYLKGTSFREMLSAPIEKGVWVTAVLEEGGVIGFSLFVMFLLGVLFALIKYKAYIAASTFFVFIVSNMGEFSFFSMSYLGGFMWTLVFAGVMLDSARAKAEFYAQQRQQMMLQQQMMGMTPQ